MWPFPAHMYIPTSLRNPPLLKAASLLVAPQMVPIWGHGPALGPEPLPTKADGVLRTPIIALAVSDIVALLHTNSCVSRGPCLVCYRVLDADHLQGSLISHAPTSFRPFPWLRVTSTTLLFLRACLYWGRLSSWWEPRTDAVWRPKSLDASRKFRIFLMREFPKHFVV